MPNILSQKEFILQVLSSLGYKVDSIIPFSFFPVLTLGIYTGLPVQSNTIYAGYFVFQTGNAFTVNMNTVSILLDTGLNSNSNIPIFCQSCKDSNASVTALITPYQFTGWKILAYLP